MAQKPRYSTLAMLWSKIGISPALFRTRHINECHSLVKTVLIKREASRLVNGGEKVDENVYARETPPFSNCSSTALARPVPVVTAALKLLGTGL
ncbi:MAG: hypothetical protein ABS909_09870, partial [Arthrobacter sp.]